MELASKSSKVAETTPKRLEPRKGRSNEMAIPTVMGTEIEFGIMVKNDPDFDPISSCVLIVNAYREDPDGKILWDYDQENPLADARGFQVEGEKYTPNQQENIARNKTLINGARFYVDHAHPEYSSPEVTNARDLVIHEKAGSAIIEISRREGESAAARRGEDADLQEQQ